MIGEEIPGLSAAAYLPDGTIGAVDYHDDILDNEKWLVLFFYPADFTWVCPTELHDVREKYAAFQELGADVWAISTDGVEVHKRWVEEAFEQLPYPVLSDRNWGLSADFGCLNPEQGVAYRCTVIIDDGGFVRHYSINDNNVGREVGEILRLIAAFQASDDSDGQVAPCGWKPGDELLTPGE